jgi:hypothetical protein
MLTIGLGMTPSHASTADVIIHDIKTTNINDQSITISWLTNVNTTGEIHYGTAPDKLDQVGQDDRGASTSDDTHYVILNALNPDTTYYFDVYSNGTIDDNQGNHYSVATGPTISIPASDTIYGQVYLSNGTTPAEGCIVYIILEDADGAGSTGQALSLSSLVDKDGWWFTNLASSRLQDLSDYFSYSASGDHILLNAQCANDGTAEQTVDTGSDSPAPDMITQPTATPTPTPEPGNERTYLPLTMRGN